MNKEDPILKRQISQYHCCRTLIVNFETMCSCGSGGGSVSVNTRSKLFCIVFTFNLLLVLLLIPEQIMGKVMSSEKGELSSAQTSDSAEDEAPDPTSLAYMDDDTIRFVTDDDDFVYEDEINQHHNNHYQQNLKGGNSRISLQQEKCPPLPEPSAVAHSRLCEAKICHTDEDCARDESVVCCYNGCIHSCLPKVNPPVAFDWVEETELKQFSEEESFLHKRPETVSLPGGCQLESEQYADLIEFRVQQHVKACSCKQGEVLCEILHEDQQNSDS